MKTSKKEIANRIKESTKKFTHRKIEAEIEKARIKLAKKFLHDEHVRVRCWSVGEGGVMIGIWKVEDNYRCAAAFRSPKDRFDMSRGKVLIAERLQSGGNYFLMFSGYRSIEMAERLFRITILSDIVQDRYVPKWLRTRKYGRILGPGLMMDQE